MRSLVARTSVAAFCCHVGGPLVFPRTSERLDILPWRATPRRCPDRTAMLFLGRTARVGLAWQWGRVRGARHLLSSCDPRGVEPSRPRFRRAELSAPVPPPAWHELSVVARRMGDGGAVHASSWAERRGGEGISGPSTVLAQSALLPVQALQLSVFFPEGSHQLVNFYACSLFQMVMQKDTKIYLGSGKRRP